jgi:hypothetical protein
MEKYTVPKTSSTSADVHDIVLGQTKHDPKGFSSEVCSQARRRAVAGRRVFDLSKKGYERCLEGHQRTEAVRFKGW